MPTTIEYEQICADMPEGLERQVLNTILKGGYTKPEKRISRKMLIYAIFGKAQSNLQNSKEDRQIRRAIVKLVEKNIPILSDSGRAGYYIGTRQDRETSVAELIRRRNAIDEKIRRLRRTNEANATISYLESKATQKQLELEVG